MVSEGYDIKTKVPQFFSETKFANHVSKVYEFFLWVYNLIFILNVNFMFIVYRTEFPALVRTLEDVKMQLRDGTSEQKEKSKKADLLLSEFYNVPFALSLSFLCDIYRVYATASNILQVIFNLMNMHAQI